MGYHGTEITEYQTQQHPQGRWPPNLILDDHAAQMLDAEVGERPSNGEYTKSLSSPEPTGNREHHLFSYKQQSTREQKNKYANETGGPSRFFPVIETDMPIHYCAKASTAERQLPNGKRSDHPTVKPLQLIRWLVRLVTPPGGTVLDPFYGSGTTGCAARLEGFQTIGIEQHEPYLEIAVARVAQKTLWGEVAGNGT